MKPASLAALGVSAVLLLSVGLSLANDPRPVEPGEARSWRTAARHSAGIAPDPVRHADTAIVQVYAAATYGWRGYFAVHPWIIYKRAGDTAYTRYDVIGWGSRPVVRRNHAVPDGLWFGATPSVLVDHRGEGVEAMIDAIAARDVERCDRIASAHADQIVRQIQSMNIPNQTPVRPMWNCKTKT